MSKYLNSKDRKKNPGVSSQKTLRAAKQLAIKLAVIVVFLFLLLEFVVGIFVVHNNDMYPAVRDGDLCITYRLQKPGYGNLLSYKADGKRHFGRIIGLPGDVIAIDDSGYYTVNGSSPNETSYYRTDTVPGSSIVFPYTVEKGQIFVLSDYRDVGNDSRIYGAISKSDTDGTVCLLLRRRSW